MTYLQYQLDKRNMTQKELATRLGVTPTTICNYCNGKKKKGLDIETAYNIAMILEIPIEKFVKGVLYE